MTTTTERQRLYRVWVSLRNRCSNPKNADWHKYGGRGISVCDRWQNSFDAFIADMGPRPPGYSIDRRDNNGNYERSNCRWATPRQQSENRRAQKRSATGLSGVRWHQGNGAFQAYIRSQRKPHHLGTTPDFFEACCMRKSAENHFFHP